MTRTLALLVLLVSAVAVGALAAPRIAVDLQIYNYSDTVSGIAIVHTFVLSNVGDQELVISKVETSCHCTTTQLASTRLSPGSTLPLLVVFDTSDFVGFTQREITVSSNDPLTPQLQLQLTGRLLRRESYQRAVTEFLNEAYVLVDVRDAATYAAGHLLGAMNIPVDQAAAFAASLPPSALHFCYDQDGASVGTAVTALRAGGLAGVYAVCGGIGTWGQRRPWASLLIAGSDGSWGEFLDVSGARGNYAGSTTGCKDVSNVGYYVLIDLRLPASFAEKHLAGAVNMTEASASSFVSALPSDVPVILYSDSGSESDRLASSLSKRRGLITSLLGGLAEWQKQYANFLVVASAG
jgi:rhodanese-related sulfurtransferase